MRGNIKKRDDAIPLALPYPRLRRNLNQRTYSYAKKMAHPHPNSIKLTKDVDIKIAIF